MKRVYVVFESSSDSCWNEIDWKYVAHNYEDKFIDVYDEYSTAVRSIRNWAEQWEKVVHLDRKSEKSYEELTIVRNDSPYSNKDKKLWLKREIRSVLLKSS